MIFEIFEFVHIAYNLIPRVLFLPIESYTFFSFLFHKLAVDVDFFSVLAVDDQ